MLMAISSYKDLVVWQKSFQLSKDIYKFTNKLPKTEQFGLSSQLQRCAVSIPSNIAEGQQRASIKEYRQFLGIAKGSAGELETQLLIAQDVYGADARALVQQVDEIQKMLFSLSKKLVPKTSNLEPIFAGGQK